MPPLSIFLSQLKDEAFEETEKNFRMQERLIKSFIRDLSLYLQHVRVSLDMMPLTTASALSSAWVLASGGLGCPRSLSLFGELCSPGQ